MNMNNVLVVIVSVFAVVSSRECWWSGCQPKNWAQRGCFPADKWERINSKPCDGGDMYYCCERSSSNPSNPGNPGSCFVTKDEFVRAVTSNGFLTPRDDQYNSMCGQARPAGAIATKQELAMFLAQILHESGGLRYKKEIRCEKTGCPGEYDNSVGAPGKSYYGRGYIQLSHSYNYKAASEDLYHDLRLINNPDLVSDDENVSWATTFWYWRTRVRNQPNVLNYWFGSATRAINGGIECSGSYSQAAHTRFEYYKKCLTAFNINAAPIERGCYN